jgi:hypothetical protein
MLNLVAPGKSFWSILNRLFRKSRGRTLSHLSPHAHPVFVLEKPVQKRRERNLKDLATELMVKVVRNNDWRQRESFNLIPSEQTPSLLVRLFSMTDPSGRYAKHR